MSIKVTTQGKGETTKMANSKNNHEHQQQKQQPVQELEFVQKYYLRKSNGEIDYSQSFDYAEKEDFGNNIPSLWNVRLGNSIGYMDTSGNFVVPLGKYDYIRTNCDGKKQYCPSSMWGCLVGTSRIINDVYQNNCVGVIDNLGNELVPCVFEDVRKFEASKNFIPIAQPDTADNSKLLWGMYDINEKKVSVEPKYKEIKREYNGYAAFRKGDTWGLLNCSTGIEVIPPIYLLDFRVSKNGLSIAFLGGDYTYTRRGPSVSPKDCHVLVTHGVSNSCVVLSGYKWIEFTGPSVVSCKIGYDRENYKDIYDTFKIIPMETYIALIKNATYKSGYFLEEDGSFVENYNPGKCTTFGPIEHALYVSGGTILAKTYNGGDIPVTAEMEQEILKCVNS